MLAPESPRLLVAVDGLGDSEALVRAAQRLAEPQGASWTVAFVDLGVTEPAQQTRVEQAFQLAERLGGDTVTLRGSDPVAEILAFVRAHDITTLVLGRSRRRPLAGLFGRTLSQRLLRTGGAVEIIFVRAQPPVAARRCSRMSVPGHRRATTSWLSARSPWPCRWRCSFTPGCRWPISLRCSWPVSSGPLYAPAPARHSWPRA
ncbi:MAG: universal stress protein [Chromatiales bacterium]|nr:universal stress protein [Chromatiales bacterium]